MRPRPRESADLPAMRRRAPLPEDSSTAQLTSVLPGPVTRRRWAMPALFGGIALLTAVALTLLIVGRPTTIALPSSTPPSGVPSSPKADPAPSLVPVIVPPRRDAEVNECVDSTGEGGAVDLDWVRLKLDDGNLLATFELVGALPDGEAGLGIYAESGNGQRSYQFATLFSGGELVEFFVHDFSRDDTDGLDHNDVEYDGSTVVAVIPDDIIKRLGNDWKWYAFGTASGVDVDACPGEPLTFEMLQFEPVHSD